MSKHTTILRAIDQAEKLHDFYRAFYELLLDTPYYANDTLKELSQAISLGEILTLEELGERFNEEAYKQYKEAQRLLTALNRLK